MGGTMNTQRRHWDGADGPLRGMIVLGCLVLAAWAFSAARVRAQGYARDEAAGKMTAADGFQIKRVAGDPDVLLRGFGMDDAHSVANSLTWGPDGWLYGCQGSTVTARIRGIEFQQGVWRYHPITRRFELFCEGGGNSWGLDFDRHGNLLYSTNHGGFVMLHGVQGGYYWKAFGKHGALHNPYAFGYIDHVPHQSSRARPVTV